MPRMVLQANKISNAILSFTFVCTEDPPPPSLNSGGITVKKIIGPGPNSNLTGIF